MERIKVKPSGKGRKKYIWRMSLALLVMVVCCLIVFGIPVKAAAPVNTNTFGTQSGVIRYIANYRNYYIDMEETGLLEISYEMLQSIANILWGVLRMWGMITTVLFYFCIDFNLAELLGSEINAIQSSLMGSIFTPLFSLGFCGAAIVVIKNMVRRDSIGILSQFAKVIGVWVLSMVLVNHTGAVLNYATGITKAISAEILVSMGGGSISSTESYAIQTTDVIWNTIVHQPWVYIEFMGNDVDEGTVRAFLDKEPGNPTREQWVNDDETGAFSMGQMSGKIAFIAAYSLPFIIKCIIYIVLSVITLANQFFAVFYILLAPLMLILMMIPGYERAINTWMRKLLETQVSVLLLTMALGLLVKVDDLLYTRVAVSWGWFVVLVVQAGLELFIVVKHKDIMQGFNNLQRAVSNPLYAAKAIREGSVGGFGSVAGSAIRTAAVVHTAGKVIGAVGGGAGKAIGAAASGVGKAVGGAAEAYQTNQAVSHVMAAAGNVKIPQAAQTAARPRMSDCPNVINVKPVKGHLERVQPKTEAGGTARTVGAAQRPHTGSQALSTQQPQGQPVTPVERPTMDRTSVIRTNTPDTSNLRGNGQEKPLERPKLEPVRAESVTLTRSDALIDHQKPVEAPRLAHENKVNLSGTERMPAVRQTRVTQRREQVRTVQTNIPRESAGSRLQADHTVQAAKVERPQSSVKKP